MFLLKMDEKENLRNFLWKFRRATSILPELKHIQAGVKIYGINLLQNNDENLEI